MIEVCEFRDGCQDEKSPVVMEDCVNKNLDHIPRKYLNELNEIGVNKEVGIVFTENKYLIYREVTEIGTETNWDTFERVNI